MKKGSIIFIVVLMLLSFSCSSFCLFISSVCRFFISLFLLCNSSFFVVVLVGLSCSFPCLAGGPLTLPAAIQKALKGNPSVQVYEKRLALAGLNIKIAKTAHWGELTGGATLDKSEDALIATPMTPRRMREGIQFDDTRWGFNLMYKLPIYLGGKIPLSIDISRLNEISTRLALKRLKAIIRHNVTELYYAILALDGEETAVKETLKALHSVLEHTEFSIAQGKIPPVDKYKINYSIQRWQAEADKITNQREALKIAAGICIYTNTTPVLITNLQGSS